MLCSFWRLQQIYKTPITKISNISMGPVPYINIGIYRNNPYKKSNLCRLIPSSMDLTTTGLELINFLKKFVFLNHNLKKS